MKAKLKSLKKKKIIKNKDHVFMFAWCSVCIISHKVIRKTKCNRQEERKITKEENAPFCHELCKKKRSKIKNTKVPTSDQQQEPSSF